MKRIRMLFLIMFLTLATLFCVTSCTNLTTTELTANTTTEATTEATTEPTTSMTTIDTGLEEELDDYIDQVSLYVDHFSKTGMSAQSKIAALQFQSDISFFTYDYDKSYEENKAIVDGFLDAAITGIAQGFEPKYSATADIGKYLYDSGVMKFTDLGGMLFGEIATALGGGRASFSAGSVAYESRYAVYTADEFSKILALEDDDLKTRMLAVANVSDLIRSSVVSFTFDNRFVMTNHYTELGVEYLNAIGEEVELNQEYYVFGTFDRAEEPISGTNEYEMNVVLEDESTLEFVFNCADNTAVRKNYIFTRIPMIVIDETPNATGGTDFPAEELVIDEDPNIIAYRDIRYGNRTMEALDPTNENYNENETEAVRNNRETLSVFVPADLDTTRENGVIMLIHGGSWTGGDKIDMEGYCCNYTKMGYITATMSHTYGGRIYTDTGEPCTFIDIENEIDQAFAKIKEMSDEYGWNITKGAISGYSSGSHLAALYAYDKGNEEDAPIPIVLTFSMVGPLSFYQEFWNDGNMPLGPMVAVIALQDPALFVISEEKEEEIEKIMSGEMQRSELDPMEYTTYDEETYKAKLDSISPISFVLKGDAVPTVAGYAMLDTLLVSALHGIRLDEALTALEIEHDVIMFPNSEHFSAGNAECGNVYRMRVIEYLEKYFGY